MKCCIIGLGVGMAHVCALSRRGDTVSALVDLNVQRLANAKKSWKNEWGGFTEEVDVNPGCEYSTTFSSLREHDFDLVIIAVPPNVQYSVYRDVRTSFHGPILLEKPLVLPESEFINLYNRITYVCCEWINHSKLSDINRIDSIRMSYPVGSEVWKSDFTAWDDLSPHLYSILLSNGITSCRTVSLGGDNARSIIHHYGGSIYMETSREEPYGLQVNHIQMDWELDLFDKYYDNMLLASDLHKLIYG